jgi:hypothetical protein
MLGIVQDRVVTSGQKWWCERDIIESDGAGFRRQIQLELCGREHFVPMQGLHEGFACLVATWINGTIETGNGDNRLSRKRFRHDWSFSVKGSLFGQNSRMDVSPASLCSLASPKRWGMTTIWAVTPFPMSWFPRAQSPPSAEFAAP